MDLNTQTNTETTETEVEEVETSLREDLEAVYASQTTETPEPAAEPAAAVSESAPARADGRDDKGRFASKAASPAGAAEPAAQAAPAGAPAPAGVPAVAAPAAAAAAAAAEPARPAERAPQSWKPMEREAWAQVPPAAREAVLRREQEVQRVLQETAEVRKGYNAFQETIRPFEAMIRAEGGGDTAKAVGGLLQTAYALRTSPPQQRAQIISNLIRAYDVPIEVLDSVLAGQPAPATAQQGPAYDPRVDQLVQRLEAAENAKREAVLSSARGTIEEFSGQHEFYEDVRADMADVLEMAARRGQKMTLAQAYERAVALNPDIQAVVQQREKAKGAPSAQAQVQRARAASSSVPSKPVVAPSRPRGDTSLREDIEESLREIQGR